MKLYKRLPLLAILFALFACDGHAVDPSPPSGSAKAQVQAAHTGAPARPDYARAKKPRAVVAREDLKFLTKNLKLSKQSALQYLGQAEYLDKQIIAQARQLR